MKTYFSHTLLLLTSTLLLNTGSAMAQPVRGTLWGYGGSDVLARGDIMAGFFGTENRLFWGDAQGKYGQEGTWMGSLGAGYRGVYQNSNIFGIYGFMDYNVSPQGNGYWVASPGIESLGCVFDFRLNGYFPVSNRTKRLGPAFAADGITDQFMYFSGHSQYDRLFSTIEEVGTGVDGEVGVTLPYTHNVRAFVGGYYFNFQNENVVNFQDSTRSSITGVSGRLEFPLRPNLVVQAIDTYDNFAHNTALIGLQMSFGGCRNATFPTNIRDRILDPIQRNLGTQSRGYGVPFRQAYQDLGQSVLVRDDIYFFDADDGSAFNPAIGAANGTFENPLAGDQFIQSTINAIDVLTPAANFYFTPGTYQFDPVDLNARISLHTGQSMFGRTLDYSQAAQGDERALFLGGIDFGVNFAAGNNRLDSIRVDNSITTTGNAYLRVLDLENSDNIVLFNVDLHGRVAIPVDLGSGTGNAVSGIYGNNSSVIIQDSSIFVEALVGRDNNGVNFAAGIGGNTTFNVPPAAGQIDFTGNNYTIINSQILAVANVGRHNGIIGTNFVENFAAAIGSSAANIRPSLFVDNTFTIKNSLIDGRTLVTGDNYFGNFATGLGGNNNAGNNGTLDGTTWINNNVVLLNDTINATAVLLGSNRAGGMGSGQNSATGIGGNSIYSGNANFVGNDFNIFNCDINAAALLTGDNTTAGSANFATAIGGNASSNLNDPRAHFIDNNFVIAQSNLNSLARMLGANVGTNSASGIGGNGTFPRASFIGNTFDITTTDITVQAIVSGPNNAGGTNLARGVNFDNGDNEGVIHQSAVQVLGQAFGPGSNTAIGLLALLPTDVIDVFSTSLTVSAPGGTPISTQGNVNFF